MWYLGFDCATKTFAWCLAWVELSTPVLCDRAAALRRALAGAAGASPEALARLAAAAEALDRDTRALVEIADGETVDLVPGVPDNDVGTVARLTALVAYVRARVAPAACAARARGAPAARGQEAQGVQGGAGGAGAAGAAGAAGPAASSSDAVVYVAVEYQCGARARDIAAALVAHFSGEAGFRVFIVAPGTKGQLCVGDNPHANFAARYATSYDANKAHARACFAAAERLWPSSVKASSAALRGHVADSFLIALSLAKMLATGDADELQARF